MSKLVSEEQWLENICRKCNLSFESGCVSRGNNYCENYKKLKRDLEILEQIKVKIDEEIKRQEKVIIEYDNYAWKTQQLNTNFLIAVNVKNTLEKIKG